MSVAAVGALVRASWRTALSYRLRFVISMLSALVMIVPLYFIANAVQPIMGPVIQDEGANYFGFLIVGLFAASVITSCVVALPDAIAADLNSGFFEAVISTPAGSGAVATGLSGYAVILSAIRGTVLLLSAIVLGLQLSWYRIPEAMLILALLVVTYFGIGLIAAAMVIAFRTNAAIPQAAILASGFLGGVYYPTHVIPSWIQRLSDVVPLTYGLRALRQVLLDGQNLANVARDIGILSGFTVVFVALGAMAYRAALHYARRAGSLSQY